MSVKFTPSNLREPPARKVIQIAACGVENVATTQCNAFIYALCDDGTVWAQTENRHNWFQLDPIPQPKDASNDQKRTISGDACTDRTDRNASDG